MRGARGWIWLVGAGLLGLALTLAWPYFRVLDLVGETDSGPANGAMYENVLLRLLPAAAVGLWVIWRRLRADRRDLFGLMLGGSLVLYSAYVTQRMPEVWPSPDAFDPDRWDGLELDPYAFVPFGGGYRRCIGFQFATQELKAITAERNGRMILFHDPVAIQSTRLAPDFYD